MALDYPPPPSPVPSSAGSCALRTLTALSSLGDPAGNEPSPVRSDGSVTARTRRFFHLRAPWLLDSERSTDARVRVDGPCSPLVLKVGQDKPLSMPVDAGWALWRCPGEALASTGEPPLWALGDVQVTVPARRRWPLPSRRRAVDVPARAGGSDG